ncbi:LysM peptidoglycan-binding domain-containing protein [Alicyclobacillus fastidiosus]|uniref:LysM peptidoglycan-binding domain-containing protein n=1 Tax=Alicyclobacillus fastidiosus TaxID=392011 RepID=A0ABV5AFP0_9BACL|nr:LysM peptidoglycan-binding domain-containing protein [Alicyclobacillus fastidiosus]WEH11662.1 LysM peptidoglycan-binding domain-containing protein [Alicyclobacillus fastidiosus]
MSEQAREPLIRLPIDQEIFMDTVTSTDSVEDATVATEVVSFEKDGDVYELEGAVVFAGYVRSTNDAATTDEAAITGRDEEEAVRHIHHRLPFVLRVPVEAQSSGLVNVKSRLSGWALDVVSDNWLNVKGTLEIHGLVGEQGYHFQCGAQEGSRPFLRDEIEEQVLEDEVTELPADVVDSVTQEFTPTVDEASEAVSESVQANRENTTSTASEFAETDHKSLSEPEFELVGAPDDMWRHEGEAEQDDEEALPGEEDASERSENDTPFEKVSEARSGHGWAEEEARKGERRGEASEPAASESVRSELVNLDRFFVPSTPEPAHRQEVSTPESTQEPTPVASFEFEHQLDDEVLATPLEGATAQADQAPEFRGEERVVPKFTISGAVATDDQNALDEALAEEEVVEEPRSEYDVASVLKSDLWSFVDFNGPEPRYVLRYAIVAEEESLEMVADRCGCLPSELIRVNDCPNGQVFPGQALRIPEGPISIPRVTSA